MTNAFDRRSWLTPSRMRGTLRSSMYWEPRGNRASYWRQCQSTAYTSCRHRDLSWGHIQAWQLQDRHARSSHRWSVARRKQGFSSSPLLMLSDGDNGTERGVSVLGGSELGLVQKRSYPPRSQKQTAYTPGRPWAAAPSSRHQHSQPC